MGKHKELSTDERNKVVQFLLAGSNQGKPKYGAFKDAADLFNIDRNTASRYWRTAKNQMQNNQVINCISGKKNKPPRILKPIDYPKLKAIPKTHRQNQRKTAAKMGVSKTTVHRWFKMRLIISHTSCLRPQLTQDNKFLRMRFSLEAVELDRILNQIRFSNMHNTVHIDEKWFYITKGSHRYYLSPDEEVLHRTIQNKKFIGKIMFMCAVARPILAENGDVIFDGKIGIWPFMEDVVAKRKSKKRARGTIYQRPIEVINSSVVKQTLLEKIIPAIKEKWPVGASKYIKIQQDNAKPHVKDDDPDIRDAASSYGWDIHLVQQPANSPDTNILALGFFNAIQSLQYESTCNTLEELVDTVRAAFHNISPTTLNKVFLSLQGVLTEILKCQGHNNFKLPHMGKDALMRVGQLPSNLQVDMQIVREAITYLIEAGQIQGVFELGYSLGVHDSFPILQLFGRLEL